MANGPARSATCRVSVMVAVLAVFALTGPPAVARGAGSAATGPSWSPEVLRGEYLDDWGTAVDPPPMDPALVDPSPMDPALVDPSPASPSSVDRVLGDPSPVGPSLVGPSLVGPSLVGLSLGDPELGDPELVGTTSAGGPATPELPAIAAGDLTTREIAGGVPLPPTAGVAGGWTGSVPPDPIPSPETSTDSAADSGASATAGPLSSADAPGQRLAATVTGPADDAVRPGETATMDVTITGRGRSAVVHEPVTLHAPFGAVFGDLAGAIDNACQNPSPTRLSCLVTMGRAGSLSWQLPVEMPPGADPADALTGGCVDLDGDGGCGGATGVDVALPDIRPRAPAPERRPLAARDLVAAMPTPAQGAAAPDDSSDIGGDDADNLPQTARNDLPATALDLLPQTGRSAVGLVLLSTMLVAGGIAARVGARDKPRRRPREVV